MSETTTASPAAGKKTYAAARPKVPPFARYRGTSCWRKDRRRVKAYALFRAKAQEMAEAAETTGA